MDEWEPPRLDWTTGASAVCPACGGPAEYVGLTEVEGCLTSGCFNYDSATAARRIRDVLRTIPFHLL